MAFPGWDFPYCHGPIDRKESEERLRAYSQMGAFLLRTKDTAGKEFVYSYLSYNNQVNHAKVLVKGRTFTIDDRKYEGGPSGVDLFDVVQQCMRLHEEAGQTQGSGVARPSPAMGGPVSKKKIATVGEPVIKSGHLCKRAIGRTFFGRDTWKERWFVLTKNELTYYSKPIKGVRKGKIDTGGIVGIETCTDRVGRPNVFAIFFEMYTLRVQSRTKAEMREWITAISNVMARVDTALPLGGESGDGGERAAAAAAAPAARAKTKSSVPTKYKAPWYFPEFSRVHCDKVMARAAPGDYIARVSSQGDRIVMVVKDEFF